MHLLLLCRHSMRIFCLDTRAQHLRFFNNARNVAEVSRYTPPGQIRDYKLASDLDGEKIHHRKGVGCSFLLPHPVP